MTNREAASAIGARVIVRGMFQDHAGVLRRISSWAPWMALVDFDEGVSITCDVDTIRLEPRNKSRRG